MRDGKGRDRCAPSLLVVSEKCRSLGLRRLLGDALKAAVRHIGL